MEKDIRKIAESINGRNFVPKESKHIRWNYQKSDKNYMDFSLTNYHFLIVDKRDTNNEETLRSIYDSIISVNSFLEEDPAVKGKVKNGEFRYLFASCHALAPKEILRLEKFNCPVIFDKLLVNKKVLNIEDYIYRLYE